MLEPAEVIELAKARLGVESDRELASALALPRGAEARISDWKTGPNAPSWRYALPLLEAAGLLREPGEAAEAAAAASPGSASTGEMVLVPRQQLEEMKTLLLEAAEAIDPDTRPRRRARADRGAGSR